MRSLLGVRLMLSATGVTGGVIFAAIAGYGQTLVIGTLVAGIGVVFQATANILVVSLQGELQFGWASAIKCPAPGSDHSVDRRVGDHGRRHGKTPTS